MQLNREKAFNISFVKIVSKTEFELLKDGEEDWFFSSYFVTNGLIFKIFLF